MSAPADKQSRAAKFARRKVVNNIATTMALAAMAFGLFWLFWILWETLLLGIGGLSVATFTQMTPPPNDEGGLANAIFGSLLMVVLATCLGTPIGVMAGIYLAEFDTKSWLASLTRFVNDILLSAPSILDCLSMRWWFRASNRFRVTQVFWRCLCW
jgi:phosphate transport system permease protein